MNNSAVPKILLLVAPTTAILLYWLWRRRRRPDGQPPSPPSVSTRNVLSGGRQKINAVVEVPEYAIGFVIGRGGQNIRQIEQETGVRVKMLDGVGGDMARAELYGFPYQVAEASARVRQAVSDKTKKIEESKKKTCVTEIKLPGPVVGRVIGHRGETIRNIERISKARVRVVENEELKDSDRLCVISGTDQQVANAADMVRDIIAQLAIEQKARGRAPSSSRHRNAIGLPTSAASRTGLAPVEIDWSKLSACLPDTSEDSIDVFVSASCHPHCFWIQTISDAGRMLEELGSEMMDFYSALGDSEHLVSKVKVGDVCVAQFEGDGSWYRGRIMSFRDDELDVFFLDFGDSQFVGRQEIKAIQPEFLKLPFQAILCSLEDVAPCDGTLDWPAATCEELQRLTSAGEWKPLVLQVKWKPRSSQPVDSLYPEPTRVELVDTSSDADLYVSQCLIDAGLAIRPSQAVPPAENGSKCPVLVESTTGTPSTEGQASTAATNSEEPCAERHHVCPKDGSGRILVGHELMQCGEHASLPPSAFGGLVMVRVSAVRDPSLFWVQLSSNMDEVEKLNELITDDYSALGHDEMHVDDLRDGMVCCAEFEHDESWHRVVVAELLEGDEASVLYLDYGDTGKVRVENIKQLREKYLELPFQAIPLQMANIDALAGGWSQNAVDEFEALTHCGSWQSNLVNLVEPIAPGGVPKVELFSMVSEGTSVSEMMVQAGHAAWRDALPSSRCSLDSAPGPLVEEALNAVEEEDLRKSTQHLPILRSMSDHVLARAGSVSSSVPPLPSPLAE